MAKLICWCGCTLLDHIGYTWKMPYHQELHGIPENIAMARVLYMEAAHPEQ